MTYSCIIPMESHSDWTEECNKMFFPLKSVFDEVLLVSTDHNLQMRFPSNFRRIHSSRQSLAALLNIAAGEARGQFLSFLNLKSDFDSESFAKLRMHLKTETLYYFEFAFREPAPKLCALNALAANLKADWTALPCLEQCFTVDKKSFFDVGAFSERISTGVDAEFVQRWKKNGYAIKKAKGRVCSSAQEFQEQGWLKSTAKNLSWHLKFWAGKEPKEMTLT